jgi:hypothetical protein
MQIATAKDAKSMTLANACYNTDIYDNAVDLLGTRTVTLRMVLRSATKSAYMPAVADVFRAGKKTMSQLISKTLAGKTGRIRQIANSGCDTLTLLPLASVARSHKEEA